jgi:hypothetical protein
MVLSSYFVHQLSSFYLLDHTSRYESLTSQLSNLFQKQLLHFE